MQTLEKTTKIAPREGLDSASVLRSRQKYGENVLPKARGRSFLRAFFANLGDPVIKILLGALAINLIFLFKSSDVWETVGIAVSVFTGTLISTLSERGSERAYERLENDVGEGRCRVRRREGVFELPFSEVCVGDIVLLSAGDAIPADGLLISGSLSLDMSSMTGEGREVQKTVSRDTSLLPSAPASLLRGSRVTSGEGEMEVVLVGAATMLGSISREIQLEVRESPLKVRLRKLAKQISRLGYVGAVLVAAVYLFNALVIDSAFHADIILSKLTDLAYLFPRLLDAFTLGLTVVVVAVPEGLPMMIAVVLSSNVRRMARRGVLVKKAVGIEAAGSMDLLFTDKTGTLTEGVMKVSSILSPDGELFDTVGEFLRDHPEDGMLYTLCATKNTSSELGFSGGREQIIGGNATDRALLSSVKGRRIDCEVIRKLPFDSARKFSAAEIVLRGERIVIYKGAPEYLLPHISGSKQTFVKKLTAEASLGARGLIVAVKRGANLTESAGIADGLTLVCGVLLRDPIRKSASAALSRLRGAGVQVVMVTGDSRATAEHIANACSLATPSRPLIIESSELARMSDREVADVLPRLSVVARALPSDKSRLVRIAQGEGRVTGMTGDGINDAPALRAADVGFAMGCGSAVAKDAGDVVILSNDLDGIANAVLFGRNIFKSIRKFICLQLTVNLSAVGISMAGPFIGIDSPVTVVQMLWLNLIMDTLGGLAFAGEAAEERIMRERPKRRDEEILSPYMKSRITFLGLFSLALSLWFLLSDRASSHFIESAGDIRFLTGFFAFFVFLGLFNCFNSRSDRLNLFSGLGKNAVFVAIITSVAFVQLIFTYIGGAVLRTVPLTSKELFFSLSAALAAIPAGIIHTLIRRLRGKQDGF